MAKIADSPLTPAVFHILLALADGPAHGYALMRKTRCQSDGTLRMGPGTIYGSLQRLEEAELVEEISSPASGPGRPRRTFRLTPAGRRTLSTEAARVDRLAGLVRAKKLVEEPGR